MEQVLFMKKLYDGEKRLFDVCHSAFFDKQIALKGEYSMEFKTADLCDEYAKELSFCTAPFHSFGKRKRFSGPIVTVRAFEDNVLVKEALQSLKEGDVLVVDGGGSMRCAMLGDKLGSIATERKAAGIIINGCVRDSVDLSEMDIGILALGTNPFKSNKEGKGERGVSLFFGDIDWVEGHYVYADEDGIVVANRQLLHS